MIRDANGAAKAGTLIMSGSDFIWWVRFNQFARPIMVMNDDQDDNLTIWRTTEISLRDAQKHVDRIHSYYHRKTAFHLVKQDEMNTQAENAFIEYASWLARLRFTPD